MSIGIRFVRICPKAERHIQRERICINHLLNVDGLSNKAIELDCGIRSGLLRHVQSHYGSRRREVGMLSIWRENIKYVNPLVNTSALIRWATVLICLLIGALLSALYNTSLSILVGSFVGAALSISLNWVITTLEKPDVDSIPTEFLRSAKIQISNCGYYRTKQILRISIFYDENIECECIKLSFKSKIIPILAAATIRHPSVRAPDGIEKRKMTYKIGGNVVADGQETTIYSQDSDELEVVYIFGQDRNFIEDDHLWPSPVQSYCVDFEKHVGYQFKVGVITAGSHTEFLHKIKGKSQKIDRYTGKFAAFTTQGLRWSINKIS